MKKKNLILPICLILLLTLIMLQCQTERQSLSFIDRIQPIPKESGFRMDGYYIWGGSVIKVDGIYHMFASRWDKEKPFPEEYKWESEIVHATSDQYIGPYSFKQLVIGERDSVYWDSNMSHNPTIHKIGDQFVLFYNASDFTTYRKDGALLRRIGYATATSIQGPWKRNDQPLFEIEANNPAVYVEESGEIKLMFRNEVLRVFVATAPGLGKPFTIQNDNAWNDVCIEDFYLFKHKNQYHMICEDNKGDVSGHIRWGIHLVSDDGVHNWKKHDPLIVYDHDIQYADGTLFHCTRRERPQLYIVEENVVGFTTAVYDGENTWCQPVEIVPGY